MVELLLERKADVNSQDRDGRRASQFVIQHNAFSCRVGCPLEAAFSMERCGAHVPSIVFIMLYTPS